jgi:fibronectin type 3 domain-containing protein
MTGSGHHHVTLSWTASPGANYYSVWRTTVHSDGVGGADPLRTILLDDTTTGTTYTDTSPTDGRTYSYHVQAISAAGASGPSDSVTTRPLPPPPDSAPQSLAGRWTKMRDGKAITLSWSAVPGATGYVIYRSKGSDTAFQWPQNFLTALVETTYVDKGSTEKGAGKKGLDDTTDYSFQVTAVNAAGISPSATIRVPPAH